MSDESGKREMVQRLGVAELGPDGQLGEYRRTVVDAIYESPLERYLKINKLLKKLDDEGANINTWDIICFVAYQLAFLSKPFEWLLEAGTKAIVQNVIFAHYYDPDTNCGIESRRVNQTSGEPSINPEGRSNTEGESETGSKISNGESSKSE